MAADEKLRRAFFAREAVLDEAAADEVRVEPWGTVHLTPSLPLVWHANWIAVEGVGLELDEVAALAGRALDVSGLSRRSVVVLDQAEGQRLATEAEAASGWEVDQVRYMVWRGERGDAAPVDAREVSSAEVAPLRRPLIASELPADTTDVEATTEEVLTFERRIGAVAGVRWFVAPAAGEPQSACCLYDLGDGIGQVEDVGTLETARERGLARAVVEAALAAAHERGDRTIFLTADARDWPQRFYERVGFEPIGDTYQLRLPY